MATMTNNLQVNDAGIEEARVQLADARREAARYQKLLEKDAVTRQQYDKVQTAAQAAQARYDQLLRAKRTPRSPATNRPGIWSRTRLPSAWPKPPWSWHV